MAHALAKRERDVAGAGRQIERASARGGAASSTQSPLPAPILPVREDDGDQIVPIGDRREQRSDVAALALRRRDPILQPTWSSG